MKTQGLDSLGYSFIAAAAAVEVEKIMFYVL
jgi:hypothetical protein